MKEIVNINLNEVRYGISIMEIRFKVSFENIRKNVKRVEVEIRNKINKVGIIFKNREPKSAGVGRINSFRKNKKDEYYG